jgi:hypothetical protein
MLTEALTALAATGGTALVTAMVTDGWEEAKSRSASARPASGARPAGAKGRTRGR